MRWDFVFESISADSISVLESVRISSLNLDSEFAFESHAWLALLAWCGLRGLTTANKKISHCGVAV